MEVRERIHVTERDGGPGSIRCYECQEGVLYRTPNGEWYCHICEEERMVVGTAAVAFSLFISR